MFDSVVSPALSDPLLAGEGTPRSTMSRRHRPPRSTASVDRAGMGGFTFENGDGGPGTRESSPRSQRSLLAPVSVDRQQPSSGEPFQFPAPSGGGAAVVSAGPQTLPASPDASTQQPSSMLLPQVQRMDSDKTVSDVVTLDGQWGETAPSPQRNPPPTGCRRCFPWLFKSKK